MTKTADIALDWYQDTANVIETKDGKRFEMGEVVLTTLGSVVVGFTYYHHLLPVVSPDGVEYSFITYQKELNHHRNQLEKIRRRIRNLQEEYPEISEEGLTFDDPDDPWQIDLSISTTFPVPFLPTENYQQAIRDKVIAYVKILGTKPTLEILDHVQHQRE